MQAQLFPSKELKIELLRHDLTVSDVARHLGENRSQVSQVLHNFSKTPRIRFFLERILDDMRAGTFTSLEDYEA